jgi:hypothetical protein
VPVFRGDGKPPAIRDEEQEKRGQLDRRPSAVGSRGHHRIGEYAWNRKPETYDFAGAIVTLGGLGLRAELLT